MYSLSSTPILCQHTLLRLLAPRSMNRPACSASYSFTGKLCLESTSILCFVTHPGMYSPTCTGCVSLVAGVVLPPPVCSTAVVWAWSEPKTHSTPSQISHLAANCTRLAGAVYTAISTPRRCAEGMCVLHTITSTTSQAVKKHGSVKFKLVISLPDLLHAQILLLLEDGWNSLTQPRRRRFRCTVHFSSTTKVRVFSTLSPSSVHHLICFCHQRSHYCCSRRHGYRYCYSCGYNVLKLHFTTSRQSQSDLLSNTLQIFETDFLLNFCPCSNHCSSWWLGISLLPSLPSSHTWYWWVIYFFSFTTAHNYAFLFDQYK